MAALAILLICGGPCWSEAQDASQGADAQTAPPEFRSDLPEFMQNKPRIPDLLLKNKKEGSYFTGIPAIGVDPNSGFNYGVIVEWYDDGKKDSPFFTNAPYRKKLTTTVNLSTHGYTEYSLNYDQPYVADSPWRIRSFAGYIENTFEDYFGIGTGTLNRLTFTGLPGVSFGGFDEYRRQLNNVTGGKTWAYYNYYGKTQWLLTGNVERDFFGGLLRPLAGFQVDYVKIHDYTGAGVNGAENQPTRLREDALAGQLIGVNGGWLNLLRLGLTYDTRDYEPDPHSGMLAQVLLEGSTKVLGSVSNFGHVTGSWRGYTPLFPEHTRLVLAGAADYSVHFADTPFFAYPSMSLPGDERMEGLGGWRNLRGYYANRFTGKVEAHAGAELRWTFADFTLWNQNLKPMLAPFFDAGRVFDSAGTFTFRDWKPTGGIGFRLAWNLATVISVDYGFSSESNLLYVNLGTAF
jgi:outer membrane protein assembly factor BamA